MTAELVILRGPSASGKSTLARKYVEQGYCRVNKDSMRSMLHNDVWNKFNEKVTVAVHDGAVRHALLAGRKVVVDNTHLLPRDRTYYEGLARDYSLKAMGIGKIECIIVDFFNVPFETCILRDSLREGVAQVGDEVIRKQFKQMRELIDAETKS